MLQLSFVSQNALDKLLGGILTKVSKHFLVDVEVHACNPCTWEVGARKVRSSVLATYLQFSLVYWSKPKENKKLSLLCVNFGDCLSKS